MGDKDACLKPRKRRVGIVSVYSVSIVVLVLSSHTLVSICSLKRRVPMLVSIQGEHHYYAGNSLRPLYRMLLSF
jgi:type IV secretory pathway component VirB8